MPPCSRPGWRSSPSPSARAASSRWSVGLAYIAYDTALQAFVGWQTWRLLRPAASAQRRWASAAASSVIVAAHDEAAVLPATIAALLAQSDGADEIVIADDGSTDAHGGPARRALRPGHALARRR